MELGRWLAFAEYLMALHRVAILQKQSVRLWCPWRTSNANVMRAVMDGGGASGEELGQVRKEKEVGVRNERARS